MVTEVIRIGEEPAWKAGGGRDAACVYEDDFQVVAESPI
jgi:hypothetical protein